MRLATIGTSRITESFLNAAEQTEGLDFVGAYSRSAEKARVFSNKHGGHLWFDSLETLAANPDVDLVYIASPNGLHFRQTMVMLEAGKHVICEKPIFITRKEAEQAFQAAEEHDVFLFEAIRNIRTPVFQKLKQELPRAGVPRSAVLQLIQYSSRYDRLLAGEVTNIFSTEFAGGALEDIGVYPLYVAVALFGAPTDVHYYPVRLVSGVDGSGTLVLKYADFICTVLCSKIAHSSLPSEIHGEKGTLRINSPSNIHQLWWIDAHTKEQALLAEDQVPNDMIYEARHFIDIIRHRKTAEYERLKKLSMTVVGLTEQARKTSGILFPNDRSE
ncbi:MAG: Gfo/Idh/MocA family oxidoreductase [Sporolactobacillus sp.]|jgi:predicted dehydrogenase|nr:Gfo/Idh/MocA family oxidoreductase [Sporolactobacillus sp.]